MMLPRLFGEDLLNDWMDFPSRILTGSCMESMQPRL